MNRRILLVGVAVVLALIGTVAVYSYAHNADKRALADTTAKRVLIAHQRIAAGTTWTDAVKDGSLRTENLPANSVPSTALTGLDATVGKDEVATADIAPGQVVLRESFGVKTAETGALTIPKGLLAISVQLSSDADVANYVGVQSEVVIFLTYDLSLNDKDPLKKQLGDKDPTITRVLVPRVSVIAVSQAPVTSVDGAAGKNNDGGSNSGNAVLLTLAVTQSQAEHIILGQKMGQLYLGLLTDTSVTSPDNGTMSVTLGSVRSAPIFVK